MKKKLLMIIVSIVCVLALSFIWGCSCTPEELDGPSTITYADGALKEGWIGVAYNDTVATATGLSGITYAIKEGSPALPAGLSLASGGTITGKATEETNGTLEITVVASAVGTDSKEAKFTLKIGGLVLSEEDVLIVGRVATSLESKNFAVINDFSIFSTDVVVTYSLTESSPALPAGVTLTQSGVLYGIPSEEIEERVCTIRASAEGFTSAETTITFYILEKEEVLAEGVINNFVTKPIAAAYQYQVYTNLSAVTSASVSATNNASVTFALKESGTLPEGFELTEGGDILCTRGVTAEIGIYPFTVVASAELCPDVEMSFSIEVLAGQIIWSDITLPQATVGTPYSESIIPSNIPDRYPDSTFTFVVHPAFVGAVPAGLTLSSDGILAGTPTKSVKESKLAVIVSSEGMTSVTKDVTILVRDPVEAVSSGIFEAELTDMTGLAGAGISSNPTEEGLVQWIGEDYAVGTNNDYFVGYTNAKVTLTFNITSSAAVSGVTMKLRLASENGQLAFASNSFVIRVNTVSLPYGGFNVNGAQAEDSVFSPFEDYNISTSFSLIAGTNTITLEISQNFLDNNDTKGPAIDCMKLSNYSSAILSWVPCKYNLDQPERWG